MYISMFIFCLSLFLVTNQLFLCYRYASSVFAAAEQYYYLFCWYCCSNSRRGSHIEVRKSLIRAVCTRIYKHKRCPRHTLVICHQSNSILDSRWAYKPLIGQFFQVVAKYQCHFRNSANESLVYWEDWQKSTNHQK